jgi:hypothetical protein
MHVDGLFDDGLQIFTLPDIDHHRHLDGLLGSFRHDQSPFEEVKSLKTIKT